MKYVHFIAYTFVDKKPDGFSNHGPGNIEATTESLITSLDDIRAIEDSIKAKQNHQSVRVTNYILLRVEK